MVCGAMRDKGIEMNDPAQAHTCNKERKPQMMKTKTNQKANVKKKSRINLAVLFTWLMISCASLNILAASELRARIFCADSTKVTSILFRSL